VIDDREFSICKECRHQFNEVDRLEEKLAFKKAKLRKTIEGKSEMINELEIKNEPEDEMIGEVHTENLKVEQIEETADGNYQDIVCDDATSSHLFASDEDQAPVTEKPKSLPKRKFKAARKVYKCSFCQKRLKNPWSLRNHEETHKTVKDLICEVCGKEFKSRSNLKYHMSFHGTPIRFTCDTCGVSLGSKGTLKVHMETVHSTGDNYLCCYCPRTFAGKSAHDIHIKRHNLEKNLSCPVCDAKFSLRYRLDRHILTHKEKTIKCPHCPLLFRLQYNVNAHVKRIHLGMKEKEEHKFCCTLCGKTFTRPYLLRKHREIVHEVASDCDQVDLKYLIA